jgi:hypothetical protein
VSDFQRNLGVHAVVMHPPSPCEWLASARDRDQRLETAAQVLNLVSASDPGTIVAFSAGFLHAASDEMADQLGEQMLNLARQNQLAVVFGIQIDKEAGWAPLGDRPRNLTFACGGGRRILWPTARDGIVEAIGGHRMSVLSGNDVFQREHRNRLTRSPPTVNLVLTNMGPRRTARWELALLRLSEIAPTIVVGESSNGTVPGWAAPPDGWRRELVASTGPLSVVRYEPQTRPALIEPAPVEADGGRAASVKD